LIMPCFAGFPRGRRQFARDATLTCTILDDGASDEGAQVVMAKVLVALALSCCTPVWCARAVTLGETEQLAVLEAVHHSVPDARQHGGHETVTGLRHDDGRITATVEFKPTTIGRRSRWKMVFCRRADEPEMWTCGGKCGKFYYAESISIPGQAEPLGVSAETDAAFVDAALAFARVRVVKPFRFPQLKLIVQPDP
jgi:hypothetical protein